MHKDELLKNIDNKLLEKFEMALKLSNDNGATVIRQLIENYTMNTFNMAASEIKKSNSSSLIDTNRQENTYYAKAIKRIPRWANKSEQNNHKIIRAFLLLSEQFDSITINQLRERCGDKDKYPDTYVEKFTGNYSQMKIDTDRSHGKVFEESHNGVVSIWLEVEEKILEYKNSFTK